MGTTSNIQVFQSSPYISTFDYNIVSFLFTIISISLGNSAY